MGYCTYVSSPGVSESKFALGSKEHVLGGPVLTHTTKLNIIWHKSLFRIGTRRVPWVRLELGRTVWKMCPRGMVSSRAGIPRPFVFMKFQGVNSISSLCLYRIGTLGHCILLCMLICDPYYNWYFHYKKIIKMCIYYKTYLIYKFPDNFHNLKNFVLYPS